MNLHDPDNRGPMIEVSSGTIVRALVILLIMALLYSLFDLVLVVLTAVVIASAAEPATHWLGRYRVPRIAAVVMIYLGVALVIGAVFYFFIPPVLSELKTLAGQLPEYTNSIKFFGRSLYDLPAISSNLVESNVPQGLSLKSAIDDAVSVVGSASGGALGVVSTVFGGVFSFVLIIVISFYLAVQEKGVENFLSIVTPVRHESYVIDLWKRSQKKIGLWFQGQLLLAAIIGILVYLGLTIFGVRHALLLAVVAALFELIPIFGPILAAVPAVAIALIDSGLTFALIIVFFYIIIQQFENQLIYPLVVKKVVGVSPIVAILALIAGAKLVGFLGIILAIPMASVLMEIFNDLDKEKHHLRGRRATEGS